MASDDHHPVRAIIGDAAWLAHRYDPTYDAVHFRHSPRASHREATFLTDQYLPNDQDARVVHRRDAVAACADSAPVHFVFHSAFCCSTLIARALDVEGVSMGLKEPVILNDIAGWRHRGGEQPRVMEVLDHALRLLQRPFGVGEAVVIKPSNVVNALAPAMLDLRPDARALFLHAPLRTFLGSIARKGLEGRLWARDLMRKQLKDRIVDLGLSGDDYLGLTDLQAAAVGWVIQRVLFSRLAARVGASRMYVLDSETLLERPAETLSRLGDLFQLRLAASTVAAIVDGPAFTHHAKGPARFGRDDRIRDQRDAEALHGDEIAKVFEWAGILARELGLTLH